jgi:multidrug resistance efflux pump
MAVPAPIRRLPIPARVVLALALLGGAAFGIHRLVAGLQPPQEGVRASGIVEARTVEVASEVSGVVSKRPVEKGQALAAGQLIAEVTSDIPSAQLQQADAAVQAAREQLRKAEEAVALQQGVAAANINQAAAATDTASARYGDVQDGARPQEIAAAAAAARQASAAVEVAAAQLAQLQAGLRPEEVRQADANYQAAGSAVEAARAQLADLEAGSREQDIQQARAVVDKAQSAVTKAQKDQDRVSRLVAQGASPAQQLDASTAALEAAQADLKAARERVALLVAGSRKDQITAARAAVQQALARQEAARQAQVLAHKGSRAEDVRKARAALQQARAARDAALAQLSLVQAGARRGARAAAGSQVNEARAALRLAQENQRQVSLKQADVDAARAALAQAQAAADAARATLAKFRINAPVAGLLDDTHIRVGETVRPGTSVVTLVDFGDTWVTVYVPEPRLPRVAIGQSAQVTVDGLPGRSFTGSVRRIASQAEFTPKYVQTVDERTRTVFAVEIALDNRDGTLKPGMPADAVFALPAAR